MLGDGEPFLTLPLLPRRARRRACSVFRRFPGAALAALVLTAGGAIAADATLASGLGSRRNTGQQNDGHDHRRQGARSRDSHMESFQYVFA